MPCGWSHADDPIAGLAALHDLHDLHFGSTPPADWLDLDSTLRQEVADRLARLGYDDPRTWMGWQNLEDRWIGEQHLDPVVLQELRRSSTGVS